MHIGVQLVAPGGTPTLLSGTTYYLFSRSSSRPNAVLAWFEQTRSGWRARLVCVDSKEFESALLDGSLAIKPEQASLPPWLQRIEGLSIDSVEDGRRSPTKTHKERAEERYESIAFLDTEPESQSIETADSPGEHILTRITRTLAERHPGKRHIAQRNLLWFVAYRLHGRRLEALLPAFSNIGRWDRSARDQGSPRLGRPTKRGGTAVGHSAIPLKERIVSSYLRFSAKGVPLTKVHRDALRKEFGCKIEHTETGSLRYVHPEGKPFPSYQQFRYWVIREFGLDDMRIRRFGEARFRSQHASSKGSFSQEGANYCERTEADCYFVKELPRQLLSEEPGAPLVVCRIVCTTSGLQIGVGASYGAEKAEAYRLAKFCAAIPKSEFCRIIGIPYVEGEWPGGGLSRRDIYDRGPGISSTVCGSEDVAPAITEGTPSSSGQSKATVEASHPRQIRTEGEIEHFRSDLNVYQLLKREVLWTISKNHSTDASDRLTPDMIVAGVAANPAAIATYLIDRGRTDAIPVPLEQAVRNFLTPAKFRMRDDGLWLDAMPFSCSHLHQFGLPARLPKGKLVELAGFVYPLTLNVAWVELRGKLHEVQPQLRIRDNPTQTWITLDELATLSQRLRDIRAAQREHGSAAMALAEQRFFEETGLEWSAGRRHRGPAPPRKVRKEDVPTDVGGGKRRGAA